MAKAIESLLGFRTLIDMVKSPVGGVPNVWPTECLTTTRPLASDTAEWVEQISARTNAPTVNYGSAARKMAQEQVSTRTAKCIYSNNYIDHKGAVLNALNGSDREAQNRAKMLVDYQTMEFRRKMQNTRISAISSAFRYGAIYLDGDGNILPSSSGAVQTIDLSVPAANKNQLNGVIAAAWNVAGTDILGHLSALNLAAVQQSGLPLKYAYYGSAIPGYLTGNTNIKEIMKSDSGLTSQLRQNKIPTGFGIENLEWRPLVTSFFVDSTGTNQTWFPSDFVVFMPEITRDWYEFLEGRYQLPDTAVGMGISSGDPSMVDFGSVNGMASYVKKIDDPVGLRHYQSDMFLPTFKVPSAVFIADTVA